MLGVERVRPIDGHRRTLVGLGLSMASCSSQATVSDFRQVYERNAPEESHRSPPNLPTCWDSDRPGAPPRLDSGVTGRVGTNGLPAAGGGWLWLAEGVARICSALWELFCPTCGVKGSKVCRPYLRDTVSCVQSPLLKSSSSFSLTSHPHHDSTSQDAVKTFFVGGSASPAPGIGNSSVTDPRPTQHTRMMPEKWPRRDGTGSNPTRELEHFRDF